MLNGRIIKNIEALTEEFIPSRIIHRDGQIKAIRDCLKPLAEGKKPRNIFLYGPPGTGKTCMSKYVAGELKEYSGALVSYVNCWQNSTRFNVLYKIVGDFGLSLSVHRKGTPLDEIIFLLNSRLKEKRAVVILDEVDKLEGDRVIYDLLGSPVSIIMISNSETALYNFDDRIRSRLMSAEKVEFMPYSEREIVDILKDRANVGLLPKVISDEQLLGIASISNGDARVALGILRGLAEKAENSGLKSIPKAPIEHPLQKEKPMELKMSLQENLFYDIIKNKGRISPSELYNAYLAEAKSRNLRQLTERRMRSILEVLTKAGKIVSEGETRKKVYMAK